MYAESFVNVSNLATNLLYSSNYLEIAHIAAEG